MEASLHVPLQFLDLGAGLGEGGVELAALVGGCAAFLVHLDHVVAVLEDPADGEAGGGRDAGDLVGVGRDGAGRRGRRFGGGLRFLAGLLAAAFRYQGGQGRDRLVGVGAGRLDRDDIALLGGQAHDRDQGLGVDLVVAPDQLNLGAEGLRRRRQHGGGPGVQSGGVRQGNAVGLRLGSGRRRVGDGYPGSCPSSGSGSVLQREFQNDAAAGFDHPGCGGHPGDALEIGDDDLGQQAAGVAGDPVGVEPDDGLPDLDLVAHLDPGREAVAAQHHGIEPDMDQDFDAFLGRDREGVMGVVELGHGPGDRRQQFVRDGVQGDPVSHHLLGENGIGHLIQGHEDTGKRCDDPKIGQGGCHGRCPASGAGCSLLPERGSTRKALALEPFRKCSGHVDQVSALAMAMAVSAMRFEKPHSLSYQVRIRTRLPSMTLASFRAKIDECGSWLKSDDTSGSS